MDNYIVSARKYRPVTFDTVVGQNAITQTLKNAIKSNQIAQAFLFTGPRGVGKTTCARIMAKTINCQNLTDNIEPCNECDSCKAFNTSASFNIHELDAASNNSVDDIRALVEQVRIPPQSVKYKIYIIDEVHMLSQQAFNAFLKTLEEPPHYAKFILATTEKHKILPTILSRCQIFDFNRITVDDIADHLKFVAESEHITAEVEALHIIAQKADGGLRDALSIFDQIASFSGSKITYNNVIENLNILDVNTYFEVTDHIKSGAVSQTLLTINDIYEKGHDAHHFINGLADHIRNMLVSKDPETVSLLEASPAIKDKYKTASSSWPPVTLLKCLEICSKADLNYKSAGNKRLLIELSLLQMCTFFSALENTSTNTSTNTNSSTGASTYTAPVVQKPKVEATPPPVVPSVKVQPPPPPSTEVKREVVSKSISFSQNLQENKATPVEEKKAPVEEKKEILNTPFTEDVLLSALKTFLSENSLTGSLQTALTIHKPELKDNFSVVINVMNTVLETELKNNKNELTLFLRKTLKNDSINIDVNVLPQENNPTLKPHTVKEKFQSMTNKNPDIISFKTKLELDFE